MPEELEGIELAEEVVARAAAIDVAWNVAATTAAILELGDRLVCEGVTRVVMEATGTYWKPFFFILEARGLECWLVNARDVKNVPAGPRPTGWTRCGCAS